MEILEDEINNINQQIAATRLAAIETTARVLKAMQNIEKLSSSIGRYVETKTERFGIYLKSSNGITTTVSLRQQQE